MSSRERRLELKAAGLCVDCAANKTVMHKSRCEGCSQRQNKYALERRLQLAAQGVCIDCAKGRAELGRKRCHTCAQKQKQYIIYKPDKEPSDYNLYKRAKSEREVVSWAWRNPA